MTRFENWSIPDSEFARRRDMRDSLIVTIDPCMCGHECQQFGFAFLPLAGCSDCQGFGRCAFV
jgi:hypothetical protein